MHSKTACIWLKIQDCQQANFEVYIDVNEWDATLYSKLNILNIYNFGFNKIFPENLAFSMIHIQSKSKALECDKLVTRNSEIGSKTF